jgi:hypothetical protein
MDAVGFRLYFTPLAGVLFTVPSRYCALSVTTSSQPWAVVDPASHAISRVAWYSSLGIRSPSHTLRDSHPLWCGVPAASCVTQVSGGRPAGRPMPAHNPRSATPAGLTRSGFWQIPFRSPLLWDLFRFLGVLRCFSSPTYLPQSGSSRSPRMGLPHSEMHGSQPDCGSPCVSLLVCVLHRLVVPRHPPTAHHVLPGSGVLGGRGQRPRPICTPARSARAAAGIKQRTVLEN